MADTQQDIDINEAIDRLQAQRDLQPCDKFDNASRLWLQNWCKCGWSIEDHGVEE